MKWNDNTGEKLDRIAATLDRIAGRLEAKDEGCDEAEVASAGKIRSTAGSKEFQCVVDEDDRLEVRSCPNWRGVAIVTSLRGPVVLSRGDAVEAARYLLALAGSSDSR